MVILPPDCLANKNFRKEEVNMVITPEKLWPPEILYWSRMGSKDFSEFIKETPVNKRLVLIVWGVLEAHGPRLPVATDSHLASIAADQIAIRLIREHTIQPIIFNSFIDVGSPSATWESLAR